MVIRSATLKCKAPANNVEPDVQTEAVKQPIYIDLRPIDPFRPAHQVWVHDWRALGKSLLTSLRFLMETEVHVYSFAVAVNILISFYPFLVAMILLCRNVFHWQAAIDVIIQTVTSYFPDGFGLNIAGYLRPASWQKFSWLSIFLLLFTANGIFTPLEVAFNRIWHAKGNRSFVRNQLISLGLIFVCGVVVLLSVSATTLNVHYLRSAFGESTWSAVMESVLFQVIALPMTMVMIFFVYWMLPNCKIPVRRLIPSSAAVAVLLEVSKYLNILTWPWLSAKLRNDVPPFVQSISIVLWSFVATMIILAGAEWAARVRVDTLDPVGSSGHGSV